MILKIGDTVTLTNLNVTAYPTGTLSEKMEVLNHRQPTVLIRSIMTARENYPLQ